MTDDATRPAFDKRLPFWTRVSMGHHRRKHPDHILWPRSVSVPMFDLTARGYLVTCSGCDKVWAG